MLSTALSTAFAVLIGALIGFTFGFGGYQALKRWHRGAFRSLEDRAERLETNLDELRHSLRRTNGRMGAAIAHGHPIRAEDEPSSAPPVRNLPPLGALMKR